MPEKRVADSFKVGRLATMVESFSFQDVRKRTKAADDPRRMLVDLGDGLQLVVTGVGEPSEGWVQISAEAANDAGIDRHLPAHLPRDNQVHRPAASDTLRDTAGNACGCTLCGGGVALQI